MEDEYTEYHEEFIESISRQRHSMLLFGYAYGLLFSAVTVAILCFGVNTCSLDMPTSTILSALALGFFGGSVIAAVQSWWVSGWFPWKRP